MKKYNYEDAVLKEIPEPEKDCTLIPVDISDKTIEQRKQKIIEKMYQRMMKRRNYIIKNLGIQLHEDVLPMCSTLAYMRPFMLSKQAITINHE